MQPAHPAQKLFPHTYAEWASNRKWRAYEWLAFLSKKIAPQIIRGGARILLSAPPQHGKSEFFSNWVPTWHLDLFPQKSIILGSYSQTYAEKFAVKVRDNLLLPKVGIPLRFDTRAKKKFITQAGGQMICAGVGGTVTGEPADLFVIDDPIKNYEDAMSETIREKQMDWFHSVVATRLQTGASVIIMHTRWHEDDMIGRLSQGKQWTYINLPAQAELVDPLGRPLGEALCPERFTTQELKRKETEDSKPMYWSAMYQGSPVQKGGNIIKAEWIKKYTTLPQMDEIGIFADLTFKKSEKNDYSVFEIWGRKGPDIYLIAQIRDQMGINDQIPAFNRMVLAYPDAFHKEIEAKANGQAIIDIFLDKFPGLVANNPKTEKEARLAAVTPLYHAGNVYYPDWDLKENEWVKNNIMEITKFPMAKHDDTVDTATMAVSHFGKVSEGLRALEALSK